LQSALASPFANLALPQEAWEHVEMPLDFTASYQRGNSGTVTDIELNGVSLLIVTDNTISSILSVDGSWSMEFIDV